MSVEPRWGNCDRDRKAQAILATIRRACGPHIIHGRWLDVGCGSGGIAATIAATVDAIDGIDAEPWAQWSQLMAERPNLRLVAGACDLPAPPRPAHTYDVIICNQVYEHVQDPKQLLRNLSTMLVPAGVCYFAGPNLLWPIEPHVFWPFVHWLPRPMAQGLMSALGSTRAGDLDAYSASYWQLRRWFRDAGFVWRNAIPERLLETSGDSGLARWARRLGRLPRPAHALVLPVVPGFVFLLRHG